MDTAYTRLMYPSFASIMPQVIGVWCEELGHHVSYATYTGREDLWREVPGDADVLFVCAFTQAAYLAYAVSSAFRARGVVTCLGGPHARSYSADACRHFDYVVGLADKDLVRDLLAGFSHQRHEGVALGAARPPSSLPGVRERWKFIRANLAKAPYACAVPMLGSLGCPYRCAFCIDSQFEYRPLPYEQIREDLAFLRKAIEQPVVAWHDPNFGVRFDEVMGIIEQIAAPGSIRFIAESSLSLLSEDRLKALERNGFLGLIVGIESWFDFNQKTKQGRRLGLEKVVAVAEHVNLIARHIPYVQTNFVWGLDQDSGPLPFELSKTFVDLAPTAFPSHSLFTAYGDSAPLGRELLHGDRVLDVPFHVLDTSSLHNVQLKSYSPSAFYERLSEVVGASYSARATYRRLHGSWFSLSSAPRWMGALRSIASRPRARYYAKLGKLFAKDPQFRAFASRERRTPPDLFRRQVRAELGSFYDHLARDVRDSLEGCAARRASPSRL